MKYFFLFILTVHGAIHLFGFLKAFHIYQFQELSGSITKPVGLIWIVTAVLFLTVTLLFLMDIKGWFYLAIVATIISQVLIIASWGDAKVGTFANALILLVAILAWTTHAFESRFWKDSEVHLSRTKPIQEEILTEADIKHLPGALQKYLQYTGVLGQPKVNSFRLEFSGEMRGKEQDWFEFESVQYNFFDMPSRHFYMKGKFFGIALPGYHRFQDGKASMDIKLFGLIPIVSVSGLEMDKAETVTFFNDLCLFAPAALIDQRIKWQPINEHAMKATFSHGLQTISAVLQFNEQGQLINFESMDRYDINEMKQLPFSTPVMEYRHINGLNIVDNGEAVWQYPEGPFVYGKFRLKSIEYNIRTDN